MSQPMSPHRGSPARWHANTTTRLILVGCIGRSGANRVKSTFRYVTAGRALTRYRPGPHRRPPAGAIGHPGVLCRGSGLHPTPVQVIGAQGRRPQRTADRAWPAAPKLRSPADLPARAGRSYATVTPHRRPEALLVAGYPANPRPAAPRRPAASASSPASTGNADDLAVAPDGRPGVSGGVEDLVGVDSKKPCSVLPSHRRGLDKAMVAAVVPDVRGAAAVPELRGLPCRRNASAPTSGLLKLPLRRRPAETCDARASWSWLPTFLQTIEQPVTARRRPTVQSPSRESLVVVSASSRCCRRRGRTG